MTFKQNNLIVLGLGSNIGERLDYINTAIEILSQEVLERISVSSIYESKALLKANSPKTWDKDFLNISILGKTYLSPQEVLSKIKEIEKKMGRSDSEQWSPRKIDIDILIYGKEVIKDDNLTIPHKELYNRDFVIYSLVDIIPDWAIPSGLSSSKNSTILEIYQSFKDIKKTTKKTSLKLKPIDNKS